MRYYLGINQTRETKVFVLHAGHCDLLAKMDAREFMGDYSSCHRALLEAKIQYPHRDIAECERCCIEEEIILGDSNCDGEPISIS